MTWLGPLVVYSLCGLTTYGATVAAGQVKDVLVDNRQFNNVLWLNGSL